MKPISFFSAATGSPQTAAPSPAIWTWAAAAAIALAAVTATPAAAQWTWTAPSPTVVSGGVIATPSPSISTWVAKDPTAVAANVALPPSAVFTWTTKDATIAVGDSTSVPSPAVFSWTVPSATVIDSGATPSAPPVVAGTGPKRGDARLDALESLRKRTEEKKYPITLTSAPKPVVSKGEVASPEPGLSPEDEENLIKALVKYWMYGE